MKTIEKSVAEHYGDADLLSRILAGIQASGLDPDRLKPEDLAPVEEFHIGGRQATTYAVDKMQLNAEQHVLDVGCGIGGAARYIATHVGCKVSGIDLTPEYIACADDLTKRLGLDKQVNFDVASALDMPFADNIFDAAITLHVAMNIEDREALYRETARVLKSGATFCVFDVMQKNDEPLDFPVPWAKSPGTSFLKTPEQMRSLLEGAGFTVTEVEDRTQVAIDFFRERLAGAKDSVTGKPQAPPALGVHLVMKEQAMEKFKNTLVNVEKGRIAPVLMLASL